MSSTTARSDNQDETVAAVPLSSMAHRLVDSPLLYTLLLIGILLMAAALRLYHLDFSSLWSDEGNSWAMLDRSYTAIAAAAAADIHPPGYYWLLKLWSQVFGTSALAIRGLSALLGVVLVLVTERLARRTREKVRVVFWFPLLAAFLAAANPFQIFYSQEARMYILLALESAGLFWALFVLWNASRPRDRWAGEAGFILCAIAGLWTHYSFPIVLLAADAAFLVRYLAERRSGDSGRLSLVRLVGLNAIALAVFLPWLPTAIDQVLNWPKGGQQLSLLDGMTVTLQTLLFGPIRTLPNLLWPWLLLAGLLPAFGLIALRREWGGLALAFWLLLPAGMMVGLGLLNDAFLKFLLVASPAWCLLVAAVPLLLPRTWPGILAIILFGVSTALAVLPGYYEDETARDNYQGVSAYLAAIGDPRTDLVLLDAPGQQEVWHYYDPGLPVLGLPHDRPVDKSATEQALAEAVKAKERVFALFWGADEADPEAVVENWLDRNAFKALDSWQGNLRFVAYRLAGELERREMLPVSFGDALVLVGQAQPGFPQSILAGDIAQVRLVWQALAPMSSRYKISVQLLDERDQVVAQRDSEPVGGSRPTDTWQLGEQIVDSYGLPIPFGTPPGTYRLVVAVYDPVSGKRLARADQASMLLGEVIVEPPRKPAPLAVVPMFHRIDEAIGPLQLAGYDLYKKGFGHAPETRLAPGDLAHFTFYWQAPDPLPPDWPDDMTFSLQLGNHAVEAPLAGGGYATGHWQPGELVRGEFDIVYDATSTTPQLRVDDDYLMLVPLPD